MALTLPKFQQDGTGAVNRDVGDKLKEFVSIEDFGAVPNDITKGEDNYIAIRNALKYVLSQVSSDTTKFESIDTVPTLYAGSGNFWIKGNSPFGLNRTEIAALGIGSAQYRRGFTLQGSGRQSTIFTLENTGDETWFYSNADAAFPNATSTAQHFTWKGFTVRSEEFTLTGSRKYKVPSASTINGFNLESQGWESFWAFENLQFEGLDTFYRLRGNGNGDQNTFKHVRWVGIIDKVFDINNDQSVTNRVFGGDASTYGDVIYVGEKGGGDFSWHAGSIILYPAHGVDNLPDTTTSAASPRSALHYNLGTTASGASASVGNSKNMFDGVRFEFYDDYNHLFFAERADIINYGVCYGLYRNCRFTVEQEYADDAVSPTTRNSFRDLVKIVKQTSVVDFHNCEFNEYQRFRVIDVGGTTATGAFAQITVRDSGLNWQTSNSAKGTFASRFYADISTSDRCNARFISKGNYSTSVAVADSVSSEDFDYTAAGSGGVASTDMLWANIKPSRIAWPNTVGSFNRLYLPEGSVITSVFINKPAAISGTGSVSYSIRLLDQALNVIYDTGVFTEQDAFVKKADLTTPFKVPAAPNNFIRLGAANGGGGTVVQDTKGVCLVGYFTGENQYTGTRP